MKNYRDKCGSLTQLLRNYCILYSLSNEKNVLVCIFKFGPFSSYCQMTRKTGAL